MIRFGCILLAGLLIVLASSTGEARRLKGGGSAIGFVFSYPPQANVTPINPGESSFSLTNAFGTFAWTNHQIEDPGVTPHEQYGMWFLTLTPAGGGAAKQFGLIGLGAMSMAQDQLGTVYIEQGDANWGPFLGWTYQQGSSSPEPIFAAPGTLDVPIVSGPFTPSADGTTITAPTGTVTSVDGVWTWGALDTSTDYFLLLNGARIGKPPFQASATTLTINAQGNAFWTQAHTGNNQVWLSYNSSASGGSTAGPIPVGIALNPSYYSSTSCVSASATCAPGFSISSGANVIGHLISTITVTMSNGGSFAGTYTLGQDGSNPFKIVGNQLQLARVLNSGDLATSIGGPLSAFVWPAQNGVTASNTGWDNIKVTVVP